MADLNKLVEELSTLSVLEAAELVKKLEEKWGVSAAAPVAMAAMPAAGGAAAAEAVEEKTEFNVVIKDAGAKKIEVIKVIRQLTNLGLKEAKDVAETAGSKVLESVSKEAATDAKAKLEICKNALFVYRLLGYSKPRIAVLSGQRQIGGMLPSYRDRELIEQAADSGDLGDCELVPATSFTEIFAGRGNRIADCAGLDLERLPHILLVPCLDTGNILCKLDFFLNVSRCSLVATSRGPVCIPARSDFTDSIVEQFALSVVVADRMKGEK